MTQEDPSELRKELMRSKHAIDREFRKAFSVLDELQAIVAIVKDEH